MHNIGNLVNFIFYLSPHNIDSLLKVQDLRESNPSDSTSSLLLSF